LHFQLPPMMGVRGMVGVGVWGSGVALVALKVRSRCSVFGDRRDARVTDRPAAGQYKSDRGNVTSWLAESTRRQPVIGNIADIAEER
jgi:hypothetical protein